MLLNFQHRLDLFTNGAWPKKDRSEAGFGFSQTNLDNYSLAVTAYCQYRFYFFIIECIAQHSPHRLISPTAAWSLGRVQPWSKRHHLLQKPQQKQPLYANLAEPPYQWLKVCVQLP